MAVARRRMPLSSPPPPALSTKEEKEEETIAFSWTQQNLCYSLVDEELE
jgi:hypothetical protein